MAEVASDRVGATLRRDAWWFGPAWMALGLAAFIGYAIWAVIDGAFNHNFEWGPYLSPFFAPLIEPAAWPGWWPGWLQTPALIIVWVPVIFRTTCYYFRKAYYRSYLLSPPACAVGPAELGAYRGETFLLVWQNLHRYALYFALGLTVVVGYDAYRALWFEEGFGFGVGTALLWLDAIAIAGYTLGCHALRHLIGGGVDCWSCSRTARTRHQGWRFVSVLNRQHAFWAWTSLAIVVVTDIYVRLLALGVFEDPRVILVAGA